MHRIFIPTGLLPYSIDHRVWSCKFLLKEQVVEFFASTVHPDNKQAELMGYAEFMEYVQARVTPLEKHNA